MSITYKGELEEKCSDSGGVRTIIRRLKYIVETPESSRHLFLDAHIPEPLTQYPEAGFKNLLLKSIAPEKLEGDWRRGIWIVTLTYNNNLSDVEALLLDKTLLPWERPAYDISYGSKQFVVSHTKAYRDDDVQFEPTKPVVHPITKEILPSEKEELHNTIHFTYNLQNFEYAWKKEFEGTVNKTGLNLLGNPFDAKVLVILQLGVTKETETYIDGNTYTYYKIKVDMEDLNEPYKKELPLTGYLMKAGGLGIQNIQMFNGEYGFFTANTSKYDIQNKVFVDKQYGNPAQIDNDINEAYYDDFPARYSKEWATLALPEEG